MLRETLFHFNSMIMACQILSIGANLFLHRWLDAIIFVACFIAVFLVTRWIFPEKVR